MKLKCPLADLDAATGLLVATGVESELDRVVAHWFWDTKVRI